MYKLVLLLSALFIIVCGCSPISPAAKSALVSNNNTLASTENEAAQTAKEIQTAYPIPTPCKSEVPSGANAEQKQTAKPDDTPAGTPTYENIPSIIQEVTPYKTHEHTQTPVKTPTKSIVPTEPAGTPTKALKTPIKTTETPTKAPASHTKPAETPTKAPETPTKPQDTPTKPSGTPTIAPETPTKPVETPTKAPETPTKPVETSTKAPKTPTKPPETPTKAPEFDINYWVDFAKQYAVSIGFELDSNAIYSWDNPISASAKSKYLERNIKDRLDWYLFSGTIQYIWAWAEETAPGEYNLFISYA